MISFQSILDDIRSIRIQGRENIAKASVEAVKIAAHHNRDKSKKELLEVLEDAKLKLLKTKITEPMMRNCLSCLFAHLDSAEDTIDEIHKRAKNIDDHLNISKNKISEIGSRKIINNGIVFTCGNSSTVLDILRKSKRSKKNFNVYNTETRPHFQGRIAAKEIARNGISVRHFTDSAARLALKKADMMLIGAEAVTAEGKVINNMGSELFSEIADKYDVPVYICTDSWKFDPKTAFGFEETIGTGNLKNVWMNPPKGVMIDRHSFEMIDPEMITGIISEFGVYRPEIFIEEVKRLYPWII